MIKVFIVDDHELVRTGIRLVLDESDEIEVIGEACTGEDAVRAISDAHPDVVLMDINMPGIGGIEATRRILRRHPDIRVIALTVLDDDPFPARLSEAGALGYLTKGCAAEEMLEAINQVSRGHSFVASTIAKKHMLSDWKGSPSSPFNELGSREMQIAMMILDGQQNRDISESLCLSPKTVSTYRQRIYGKLNVHNDVELTRLAYRYGVLPEKH